MFLMGIIVTTAPFVVLTLCLPWPAMQMVKITASLPQILQTREERRAAAEQTGG